MISPPMPIPVSKRMQHERPQPFVHFGESEARERPAFQVENLSIYYGDKRAIENVTIDIPAKTITAIIGPSGCGKSTFLRCLNRMHELVPRTRLEGKVLFQGEDLYSSGVDPAVVRRRIGMVFQKSNPFPTMSIRENVIVGLRLNGVRNRSLLDEQLEKSLRWPRCGTKLKTISTNRG